jgi:hypothetical protein
MAAVIAGMSLVQLFELAGSAAGTVKSLIDIANELHAKGIAANGPIPLEHDQRARAAVKQLLDHCADQGEPNAQNFAMGGRDLGG